jgi:hypothetical protein
MAKVTQGVVDRAHQIRTDLQAKVDQARNNTALSPHGKAQRIAAAWQDASSQMKGVRVNFQGGSVLNAADLQRQLFGAQSTSGADAISTRDAMERARQLTNGDEALALLGDAEMTGDEVLARAIASRAFDGTREFFGGADWGRVLDAYVETHPAVGDQLQQLADLRSNGVTDSLQLAGHTYLAQPDELSGLTNSQIEGLAGELSA